ncbi:hypothetical protein R6Y94_11350 [Plantactinospora sp. KLBMP9567]|nr:hypothetical protein [Plantactinospora sp. KLBMP9567]
MAFLDELASFLGGSVAEVDGTTVGHVVACVARRRVEPGRDPDGVDAERRQSVDPAAQPGDVADPLAIGEGPVYPWSIAAMRHHAADVVPSTAFPT